MSLRIVARQCAANTKCLSSVYSKLLHTSTSALANPKEAEGAGLIISPSCHARLQELNAAKGTAKMLRLQVEGGGCSGFQYKFLMEETRNDDDVVFGEEDSSRVVIDEGSLDLVRGSVVEFHSDLMRSAFRIAGNPQSEAACSCGASFALKI